MTSDLDQLSEKIQGRFNVFLESFLGKTADELYVVTPVDTGRMRGSWGVGRQPGSVPVLPKVLAGLPDPRDSIRASVSQMAISPSMGSGAPSKPIFLLNTARNPDTNEYYPEKINDQRGLVRKTYQQMAQFAEEAVVEAAGSS